MKDSVYIKNRKASFDYYFIRDLNAGLELLGTEVKSIRAGKVSLVDSFCYFNNGELFIKQMNISVGKNSYNHEPLRDRKLLLKKQELLKLQRDLEKGMTIVVKHLFSNERGFIKACIALAKGKKDYDKRDSIKEKDAKRQMDRDLS